MPRLKCSTCGEFIVQGRESHVIEYDAVHHRRTARHLDCPKKDEPDACPICRGKKWIIRPGTLSNAIKCPTCDGTGRKP